MARAKRRRWQFSLRALLVGMTAAAVAVAVMSWLGLTDDLVIIVAALAAVMIEAAIHKRWLHWLFRSPRRRQ